MSWNFVYTLFVCTNIFAETKPMKLEEAIQQKKFSSEYHKLALNLIYTVGWMSSQQERLFKQYDISSQQYNILRILRGQYPNPAPMQLLANRMIDKNSNATRLVDKLLLKQLVERIACPTDRRVIHILITRKGQSLLKQLDQPVAEMENLFKGINKKEAAVLNEHLDRIRTHHENEKLKNIKPKHTKTKTK